MRANRGIDVFCRCCVAGDVLSEHRPKIPLNGRLVLLPMESSRTDIAKHKSFVHLPNSWETRKNIRRRRKKMMENQQFKRTPSSHTASWFLDLNSSKQLNLDPRYQRRSVWSDEYRKFFIDSIIRNYPTQSIFVDVTINPDGPSEYRVLDGKQRLTTLIAFTNNEFVTPETLSDLNVNGLFYRDLSKELRTSVHSYLFTVENVSNASDADLNQAFDRLNRNVLQLNKQELRHARFSGAFISKMESLAEHQFWKTINLFSKARVRRMVDVEYVSELYVLTAKGIQDQKVLLEEYYAKWDEEIEDEHSVDTKFESIRKYMESMNAIAPIFDKRYSNSADFYSLWATIRLMQQQKTEPNHKASVDRLSTFLSELDARETERSRQYMLAAIQGSSQLANRLSRTEILQRVMLGEE